MNVHNAIKLAWERVQQGHGTQSIIGTEGRYDFRVCQESTAKLADNEYRFKTITAWPTSSEAERIT